MKKSCEFKYNNSLIDYCFYELEGNKLRTEISLPWDERTNDDKDWIQEENVYRIRIIEMRDEDINEYETAFAKVLINAKLLFFDRSYIVEYKDYFGEFLELKSQIENLNIPIVESDAEFWDVVRKTVQRINGQLNNDMFINFISMQKEFFLDPFMFYDIDCIYGNEACLEPLLSRPYGSKSKRRKYAIKIKEFISIFEKFSMIVSDAYEVEKTIMLEVTWEILKQVAIKYYAEKWKTKYNAKGIVHLTEKEISNVIIDSLKAGGLTEKDDEKYFQFIYYCINMHLINNLNFYNAYVISMPDIQKGREQFAIRMLKDKIMRPIMGEPEYTIDDIDMMNGKEFEEFVCELYLRMGYSAEITKQTGDQGIDVIAEKKGNRIGIQAKCYAGTVGNSAVQQVVAGKLFYNCNKAVVITNNYFTTSAIELAEANEVILINRDILKDKIRDYM